MSSLARYLSAQGGLRSNPDYMVEWRHSEGGPWLAMARAADLEDAASELASPTVSLTLGDLARVRDPEGQIVGFSVMTGEGLVALPQGDTASYLWDMGDEDTQAWFRACGYDLERAWDGCVRADWLLYLAGHVGVEHTLLVLAACDCAETGLQYVPPGEDGPRLAIETTRRWARRQASSQELEAASEAALAAARGRAGSAGWPAVCVAWTAMATGRVDPGEGEVVASYARDTSRDVAAAAGLARASAAPVPTWDEAWDAARDAALASMAPLVRQRIPLWRLALVLADRLQTLL